MTSDASEWDEVVVDEESEDELVDVGDPPNRLGAVMRRWSSGVTTTALVLALVALLGAAAALANADLGTSLRARTCDPSPLPALGLFLLAGVFVAAAPRAARLRVPTSFVTVYPPSGMLAAFVPFVLLLTSLPGTLGCELARDMARWQVLGPALTGAGGVALSVATSIGVGFGLVQMLDVHFLDATSRQLEREQPSLVELAMQEADELESDAELRRFRGVD